VSQEIEVPDAELVRYLDGEMSPVAARALEARIAADPAVAGRLEKLRLRSANLSALLGSVDPSEERTTRSERQIRSRMVAAARRSAWAVSPRLLRVAATIVILIGVTVAVPPARAWMLERVRELAAVFGFEPDAPITIRGQDIVSPAEISFAFGFPVEAGIFEIEAPAAGELLLRRGDSADGRVEVRGDTSVAPLVLPAGLRFEGAGSENTVYEVTLPPAVTAVRLRAGSIPPADHALPPAGETLTIDLAAN
jgi:hypothetical protein